MRRFYKTAEAGTAPGGHVIRLDGKIVKTPLLHNLILSSQKLVEEMAKEWQAQGGDIVPSTMPLTQLASTMIDKAQSHKRPAMNDEIVKYGSSDLVCYFATHPADLLKRQEELWLPLVEWMKSEFGIVLEPVKGIQYKNQPEASIAVLRKVVEGLGDAEFTVVQTAMGVTGSAVIALALMRGKIDAETAYKTACVDEIYQLEKWGEDTLARKKLDSVRKDLKDIETFYALL